MGSERLRQPLRAAARDRPADGMRAHHQHDAEGGANGRSQRQHRVGAAPGQQRAGALALEARAGKGLRGADRAEAEAGQQQRMARRAQGREQLAEERLRLAHERFEQPAVGIPVGAEPGRGRRHRPLQHHGRAVVERVRERRPGVDRLEAVLGQRQPAQERRGERQRVDGRAGVVDEARQRQLVGAAAAADRRLPLEHGNPATSAGERDRGRQAVRSGADDDRVSQPGGRAGTGPSVGVRAPRVCTASSG